MHHIPRFFDLLHASKYSADPKVHHMSHGMTAIGKGISPVGPSGAGVVTSGVPATGGSIAPVPGSGGDVGRHLLMASDSKQKRQKVLRLKIPFTHHSLPKVGEHHPDSSHAKESMDKHRVSQAKAHESKEKEGHHSSKIKKLMDRFAQL